MARNWTVGTRGSRLALWQANHVVDRLGASDPQARVETRIIHTTADVHVYQPFAAFGTRGVFVKEIEQALLEGTVDLAVHSLKDLPSEIPDGLALAAFTIRHDPRDALLAPSGVSFAELPEGAHVGTGSLRRRSQLLRARPDLRIEGVRGNLDTRLKKLLGGAFDALVLAVAGVERLGIDSVPFHPIDPELCLPAVGQGMLAVECRADDAEALALCEPLNDADGARVARAERSFLAELGGGCLAPATAFAENRDGQVRMRGFVGEPDGGRLLHHEETAAHGDEQELGRRVARELLSAGGDRILGALRDAERS